MGLASPEKSAEQANSSLKTTQNRHKICLVVVCFCLANEQPPKCLYCVIPVFCLVVW